MTMKKSFIYSLAAVFALAACTKEADVKVPTGETVTIIASVDQTKSTEDHASFSWATDEQISVGTSDDEYVAFEVTDAANGQFSHTFTGETPSLLVAVSPVQANADFAGADAYEVELPAVYNNYDPSMGVTNALMIGTPDPNVPNKFLFRHAAALVKVTYANVPVGTTSFVFEADENLTGTVTLGGLTTNDIEITNGNRELNGSEVWINLPQAVAVPNTTLSFYVPVPTGDYSMLNVYLANATGKIASTEKTMDRTGKNPLTLNRADVFTFPTITLDAAETLAGEWIMVGKKDNDFYAAQAFESGNNLKGASVTVSGNVVSSETYTPVKMTFTYVSEGTYAGMYTIQDANGNYLYAASGSNNYLRAEEAISETYQQHYYWEITEEGNGVYSIVASKSDNRNVLQFNSNSTLFSCYASASQSDVMLYKWADANIPNPPCATPEISCKNNVITITTATAGATIYYEIGPDETVANPTTTSSVYDPNNKPTITADAYVKAIAVAEGYSNSEVAGAAVTYKAPVVLAGWVKTDIADLSSGDEIVIVDLTSKNAMSNDNGTGSAPSAIAVTVANEKITSEVPSTIKWIFNSDSQNGYSFNVSGTSNYLYCTDTNNGVRVGTNQNRYFNFVLVGSKYFLQHIATSRFASYNKMNVDWRCYTSVNTNIQDSEVAFFKYYDDGKQEAGISFTPASATITWGETLDQPTLNNEHGLTVTYASSDPAVASLNGSTIVVNKAGTATITASWTEQVFDGVTYRAGSTDFALTVNKATPVVAFNNPTTTVNVGGSPVTNVATITPNTLAVTYSSSDDNVATVTESGVVTGIAEGTATITAAFAGNDNYEAATASYVMTVVDNRTFAVTITQPQTGGSFKVNVDGSEIATGASVQVNKTVTLTAVPATGYTLDAWTVTKTGDPTTVVAVSNDSFTMPAYAVTITASFSQGPQTLVASLSGAAMLNNAKSTSYADVTIDDPLTDTQGYKWTGRWVYQKASGVYYEMVQLKKYESSNSSRLAIPEYPGAIKSIKLTVTSANATTSDGAACTSELYFTQSYAKNGIEASGGKILTGGSSSGTNTIVLDFTELQQSYTSGYIVAGGGVRIWGVEVTYAATE